jgi:4-amino-4-deoxy-L-arabinose transferase-like glycosyltransferase
MKRPAVFFCFFVAALLVLWPGVGGLPPLDRDESRFAQASKQMVETGDLVDIRFQDEPRYKKPIGAYWLQAASAAVFDRTAIWAYRLPSWLAIAGSAMVAFLLAQALFGSRAAWLTGALVPVTLIAALEARQAKSDALLLFTVLCAQLALAKHYLAARAGAPAPHVGWRWLLWGALGAGVLVKGPITPMVTGFTVLTLSLLDRTALDRWRWWRSTGPVWGIPVLAAIALPWLIAIGVATKGAFFAEAIGHDLGSKLVGGQESHGAPPGYYIVLLALIAWPGIALLAGAIPFLRAQWREPGVRFCVAWIVPVWFVFEAVPTKLPHYVLPALPAVLMLGAAGFRAVVPAPPTWTLRLRAVLRVWFLFAGIVLAGAIAAAPFAVQAGLIAKVVAVVAGLVIAATSFLWWRGVARGDARQVWAGIAGAAISVGLALGGVGPMLDPLWVSRSLAQVIASSPHAAPVALAGYSEPSSVFLLGTRTILGDGRRAATALLSGEASVAAVSADQESAFRATVGGAPVASVGSVEGFNYSRGRPVRLSIWRLQSGQDSAQPK